MNLKFVAELPASLRAKLLDNRIVWWGSWSPTKSHDVGNSSPAPEGFSVHIRLATDLRSRASIHHGMQRRIE
jgi:hypothetical protein